MLDLLVEELKLSLTGIFNPLDAIRMLADRLYLLFREHDLLISESVPDGNLSFLPPAPHSLPRDTYFASDLRGSEIMYTTYYARHSLLHPSDRRPVSGSNIA